MSLVLDDPQRVADWVGEQMGHAAPTVDAAIGLEIDGKLVSGVYFDCLGGNNVFAHIAGRPSKGLLTAVAVYVFEQLELDRMTFQVPANNARACAFVAGMGASMEAVLLDGHARGTSLLLFSLWKDSPFSQRMLSRA